MDGKNARAGDLEGNSDEFYDDITTLAESAQAQRWRSAILRLSENLRGAARERPELADVLMEAMHNALERLLVYGESDELMALEEWLLLESQAAKSEVVERRATSDRRSGEERRRGDRRQDGGSSFTLFISHRAPELWLAEVPAVPGCASVGTSREAAIHAAREAIAANLSGETTGVLSKERVEVAQKRAE